MGDHECKPHTITRWRRRTVIRAVKRVTPQQVRETRRVADTHSCCRGVKPVPLAPKITALILGLGSCYPAIRDRVAMGTAGGPGPGHR
jgi:hypothetical protein